MRRSILIPAAVAVVLGLVVPVMAGAAPKPKNNLTIGAKPNPVTFGSPVVIAGQLKGNDHAGKVIELDQSPYPFAGFHKVAATVTAAKGSYSFTRRPGLNTRFRVRAKTAPPDTSAQVLEQVRIKVTLHLSDSTPKRGKRVRFSGFATPQHDGLIARIQKRRPNGSFRTVARTPLKDDGTTRSKYSRRLRIRRGGIYRVLVPAHVDHAQGTSLKRGIRVH